MRLVSSQVALSGLLVAILSLAAGCGSPTRMPGRSVRVAEHDFAINAPKRLSAGSFDFVVHNRGPEAHEFLVVRTSDPRLPLRTDGTTVDEDALKRATIGTLEPGKRGSLRHLRLRLSPGRYELFCNMAGHYLGGMHVRLVVG